MSAAIDWNCQPVRFPQFDPSRPDPAAARAYYESEYLERWIEGDLVELEGQDLYGGPIDRLVDDDGIERLGTLLDHMRAGRDAELLADTKAFLEKLADHIKADAGAIA